MKRIVAVLVVVGLLVGALPVSAQTVGPPIVKAPADPCPYGLDAVPALIDRGIVTQWCYQVDASMNVASVTANVTPCYWYDTTGFHRCEQNQPVETYWMTYPQAMAAGMPMNWPLGSIHTQCLVFMSGWLSTFTNVEGGETSLTANALCIGLEGATASAACTVLLELTVFLEGLAQDNFSFHTPAIWAAATAGRICSMTPTMLV